MTKLWITLLASPLWLEAQVAVTTYHNDLNRTGQNLSEALLNTSNVNVATFGKLFSRTVDGQIYAQPLYVPGVVIPGKGVHNVVYVATENNSVFAFDADLASSTAPLWEVNLGPPIASVVIDVTDNLLPQIGVTSTPAIDLLTNTIYVVAETYENSQAIFRLHALDITTGAEKFGGPVVIQGAVPGHSSDSAGGVLTFNPIMHWQRAALLLWGGQIYIAFGSHGDEPPYHGWLFGYNASTLARSVIYCTSPNGSDAGIWQGGVGPALDTLTGSLYLETGNGTMDANTGGGDYGDSILKLDTAHQLAVTDYFSPSNQSSLSSVDADLGSGGVLLIPGTTVGVGGGKDGTMYAFNRNNLGQYNTSVDQVVQEWQATYSYILTGGAGFFGGPVFHNSGLFVWGRRDKLKEFAFNGSTFNTTPIEGTTTIPDGYSNEPAMSISAHGTTAGSAILWASYSTNGDNPNGGASPGILVALNASNIAQELWNSNQNETRDYSGSWAKWCPPTIANGKVYLATFDNLLNVYGVLSAGSGGSLAGSGDSSGAAVNLTTEGSVDWEHWGIDGLDRKAGVSPQLGAYAVVGSGGVTSYSNDPRPISWTDGAPTSGSTNNFQGVYVWGAGQGFTFQAPADTTTRTVVVHVGGWYSGGTFTAHLSDGSAADYIDVTAVVGGQFDRNYTLSYHAASVGQTLTVTWIMNSGTGNVTLNAVALAGPGTSPGGSLSGSGVSSAAAVNLTTEGGADWEHWGTKGLDRKAGVSLQLGVYSTEGSGTVSSYSNDPRPMSWTDGTPTASSTNNFQGVYVAGIGNGFAFRAPADTTTRTVVVHVGGWDSGGTLTAHLSDGSAADYTDVTAVVGGQFDRNYTLTYHAGSAGQTLTVTWIMSSGTGNVTLNAVALAGPGTSSGGSLSGSGVSSPAAVNLTAEGGADWEHWGMNGLDRKASVLPQLSTYAVLGSGGVWSYSNDPRPIGWTDGAFTASTTNNYQGVAIAGVGKGFKLQAPADTTTRTVVVHVGGWYSGGTLTAHLSDGSAADYSDVTAVVGGQFDRNYTLTYHAGSAGQTLTVTWIMNSGTGNVTLNAIALAGPGTSSDGLLSGSGVSSAAAVNLTAEGGADWEHWGMNGLDRKAGVSPQLSTYALLGSGEVSPYGNDPRPIGWTDGAPTASSLNNYQGVAIAGVGKGFKFQAPADTTTRTVVVHVGGWNSGGTLTAHLSDGSAADYSDVTAAVGSQFDRNYTLTYHAASAGQTLTVTWIMSSGTGNVTLNAIALAGPSASSGGSLSGSGVSSAAAVNLTAEGGADWEHWGINGLDRKAGVAPQLNSYAVLGSGGVWSYSNDPRPIGWTDGAFTASTANNYQGVAIAGVGKGFELLAPAHTTTRTVVVHVGGWYSGGTLTAHLSDGSAADYRDVTAVVGGQFDRNYTLTYRAGSAGQTLTVTWIMNSGTGNVTLNAIALQ